jgi:hypothetical protein
MLVGVSDNEGKCVSVSVCVCVIPLPVFQVEFWRLVLSFKVMGRPSLAQAKREGPHPSMQYHKVGGSPRLRRDVIANTSCIGMKLGRRLFQIFEPNSPRKKYKKKHFGWMFMITQTPRYDIILKKFSALPGSAVTSQSGRRSGLHTNRARTPWSLSEKKQVDASISGGHGVGRDM